MSLSSGADDLAGLDARGADLELLGRAATGGGAHRLDVRVPAAVGPPVRVGHVVAEARSLATDVAHASHGILLGLIRKLREQPGRHRRGQPDQVSFDYGNYKRSYTPGGHSVVSSENGVADQTSGWDGKDYVINIRPQLGPEIVEQYGLSPDGKQLTVKTRIGPFELIAAFCTP